MIASLFASGDTRQVQTLPDGLTKTDRDHEKTTDLEGVIEQDSGKESKMCGGRRA